ncbi:MAG: ABC transporter substrate-binding protein [Betaproteobacteria bacterium]|nr:ABC transporter substrate-binding protein [Betaproteobacteria bacterium]
MNRRDTLLALLAYGAGSFPSFAQQPAKVWRIGMLETIAMNSNGDNLGAFKQSLRDLGYVEGRNYAIEYRSADGSNDRFPELAAELVRLKVDLIMTRGTPATQACQTATKTIPVVTTASAAPLLFAASLARPGGNITGLTALNTELAGKRVELLKEVVPGLARVASLRNVGNAGSTSAWNEIAKAARSVGIQTLDLDVRKRDDLAPAFDAAVRQRVQALVVSQDSLIQANGKLVVDLAARHRLAAIFQSREYVVNGGLISYGVNYPDQYRRAASYVDSIFKGAKPGDLPMEQPTRFDLMINMKTAKALGITIPQTVLLRADEVIQ